MSERDQDLMRQGFMRGAKVPKLTAAQKKAAAEAGARILARLGAGNARRSKDPTHD